MVYKHSWSRDNYPKEFNKLSPQVREKAIEIGNQMLERGDPENAVIPVSMEIASDWAINS